MMKTAATILGLCLALGMIATPAAALEDASADDPPVACTLELPPDESSCSVNADPVVTCQLDLPPSPDDCQVHT